MIEGDRPQTKPTPRSTSTVGGEPVGADGPPAIAKPRLELAWERRARILEVEVESQAQEIVNLKEEIAQQDERIKRMTERIARLEMRQGL